MQSGLKRKTFVLGPAPDEVAVRFGSGSKGGKRRAVTGLATDALNKTLVAGTLDGTLNVSEYRAIVPFMTDRLTQFFNFHTKNLEETLVLPSSVVSLRLQTESNLLAVICDDLVVRMFDIETKRLVRELSGFKGRVLDIVCYLIIDFRY